MNALNIFLLFIAFLLLVFFLVIIFVYKLAFYSPKQNHQDIYILPDKEAFIPYAEKIKQLIKSLDSKSYEPIFIKAKDNKSLFARYYHHDQNAPLAICFHGWHGNAIRDFCGGANTLFEMNHNVLIVDQRGQWNSQGHTISFGLKERYDVLSWIDYAIKEFGENVKITLYGVSMGAATVLMSTGLKLPANVKAIVADCPYSSADLIIKKVCKEDMKLPYNFLKGFIYASAFLLAHIRLNDKSAYIPDIVKKTTIPILIIHGQEDSFVPCKMSQDIYEANPTYIKRVTFPSADHGLSYMSDSEGYKKVLKDFISHNLNS